MKRTLLISLLLMFCFVLGAQEILTPKASDTPRINWAKVYGNFVNKQMTDRQSVIFTL